MQFTALLPLSKASLNIVVAVDESSPGDLFERVGRQTLWSRRIRAAVTSASDAVLENCVLHLPSESVADSTGGEVDRRWAKLHEMLCRVRSGSARGHFPELVLPANGTSETLPPMVYCAVPGKLFEIPCPSCLGPLQTCRDDGFLARLGLPLYSTSPTHYLICPGCAVDASTPTMIDPRSEESTSSNKVKMLNAVEYFGQLNDTLPGKKKSRKTANCCCVKCPEQDRCWGWSAEEGATIELRGLDVVGTASQGPSWRVFTTHTAPFVLTRPAMVPLESFVRRLGSESLRSEGSDGNGAESLIFSHDSAGMDAVEILTLKLTALRQAVEATREHYRLFDRAHLDINSESLVVAAEDPSLGLPGHWQFAVRLEATSALDLVALGEEIEVSVPPHDPVAPFFSPAIRDFMLTGHRIGELKVVRLSDESEGLWRIEGHLVDPRGVFPRPGAEDWIRLMWTEDPCGFGVQQAVARFDPRSSQKGDRKNISITTEPLALDPSAVEKAKRAGGVLMPNMTYRVFPRFGPRDDLFSLGMVLFLCTLVNDTQDLGLVTDDLGLLGLDRVGATRFRQCAADQISQHPETWGPDAVLYDTADRSEGRPNAIPKELWVDVLALGLRMVAGSPDLIEHDESGAAVMARVESEISGILRRLRALMFDRQSLNLEIQTVISELISAEKED